MEKFFPPPELTNGSTFPILLHYNLLNDPRTVKFAEAIQQTVKPGMRVLELGSGSAIMSLLAARAGATVTAVDMDMTLVNYGREAAERAGLAERIIFQEADAEKYIPKTPVDLIICEMQDTLCIRERQIQVMNRACHFLAPGGSVIARSVTNRASLAWTNYEFCGLEMPLPFFDTIEVSSPRSFLTPAIEYQKTYFDRENVPEFATEIVLKPRESGPVNCLVLETETEIIPGIIAPGSDWFNAPFVVPLEKTLELMVGDCAIVNLSYTMGGGLESLEYAVRVERPAKTGR